MDPLTALGLGANILQFIDFSYRIIGTAREIEESKCNTTVEFADLETVTQTLILLNSRIINSNEGSTHSKNATPSNTSIDLSAACEDCAQVASELISVLRRLKTGDKSRTWTGLTQAFKTILSRDRIQALRDRLGRHRSMVQLALMVSLREDMQSITDTLLQSLQSGSATDRLKKELLEAIRSQAQLGLGPNPPAQLAFSHNLAKMTNRERDHHFKMHLLEQLGFGDELDRERRIARAHERTFEWIFSHNHREGHHDKQWSNFAYWLETEDDPLYWITGKAGSGKSTLMKFIVHNHLCRDHLAVWGDGLPVVVARFYFWNSGSEIQRSQTGLLRSLLYDALRQRPDEIPRVLHKRWSRLLLFGLELRPWDNGELEDALEALVNRAEGNYKLCLFVDGLDEFEGDHEHLIGLFKHAISFPNVKAALSSRPWLIFEQAFVHRPSLLLEHMTFPDILTFVDSHFNADAGFARLKRREPDFASSLVQNIAKKSSGVFLWVRLVVRSLLSGLLNSDPLQALQSRLEEMPSDLEDFYEKMLDSIPSYYAEHAGQLFQIVSAAEGHLTGLGLYFASQAIYSPDMALKAEIRPLDEEEQYEMAEDARRWLNSRCKGLIEIPSRDYGPEDEGEGNHESSTEELQTAAEKLHVPLAFRKVAYLHRTVRDFVNSPEIRQRIGNMAPEYNPHQALLNSTISMAKSWCPSVQAWHSLDQDILGSLRYAEQIARSGDYVPRQILDEARQCFENKTSFDFSGTAAFDMTRSSILTKLVTTWSGLHGSSPPEGFLQAAASYELNDYIFSKVLNGISIFADESSRPLLNRVICEYKLYPSLCEPRISDGMRPKPPNLALIQHLLENGANPNSVVDGKTTWSSLLQECVSISNELQRGRPRERPIATFNHWANIVALFIRYGADPRMNVDSQQGSCVREAFEWIVPTRSKELEKMMTSASRRWSRRGKFLVPSYKKHLPGPNDLLSINISNRLERVKVFDTFSSHFRTGSGGEREQDNISDQGRILVQGEDTMMSLPCNELVHPPMPDGDINSWGPITEQPPQARLQSPIRDLTMSQRPRPSPSPESSEPLRGRPLSSNQEDSLSRVAFQAYVDGPEGTRNGSPEGQSRSVSPSISLPRRPRSAG